MERLHTKLCGVELDNPFILGSGPLGYGAEGLIAAQRAGAGAVVTKTILRKAACNPSPHMRASGKRSLINCELWSDETAEQWIQTEIPRAKKEGVKVLIANIGGTEDELLPLAKDVTASGADFIELGGGYMDAGSLVNSVRELAGQIDVPLLIKVNANWRNTAEVAKLCLEAGADGITAIDSIGPAIRFDLKTAQPLLGGHDGKGWLSGEAILPFALQIVNQIAGNTSKDIVGMGGIMCAGDALEMLLAGATCCGVCTLPILQGLRVFEELQTRLLQAMDQYGYASVQDASRKSLKVSGANAVRTEQFVFHGEQCVNCGRCITVCPYNARTKQKGLMQVDASRCRSCGLCMDICPTGAIAQKES